MNPHMKKIGTIIAQVLVLCSVSANLALAIDRGHKTTMILCSIFFIAFMGALIAVLLESLGASREPSNSDSNTGS